MSNPKLRGVIIEAVSNAKENGYDLDHLTCRELAVDLFWTSGDILDGGWKPQEIQEEVELIRSEAKAS